jgi:hypothetical protein
VRRWAVLVATIGLASAAFVAELDFGSEANHAVSNYQTVFAAGPTVNQNQPLLPLPLNNLSRRLVTSKLWRRWKPGKGGSTLSYQPSAELLQKTFDRMKMTSFCTSRCNGSTI